MFFQCTYDKKKEQNLNQIKKNIQATGQPLKQIIHHRVEDVLVQLLLNEIKKALKVKDSVSLLVKFSIIWKKDNSSVKHP